MRYKFVDKDNYVEINIHIDDKHNAKCTLDKEDLFNLVIKFKVQDYYKDVLQSLIGAIYDSETSDKIEELVDFSSQEIKFILQQMKIDIEKSLESYEN